MVSSGTVAADSRSPRDGRFIETVGTYDPIKKDADVTIDEEKALKWLSNGAQPTDTVRSILASKGIMAKFAASKAKKEVKKETKKETTKKAAVKEDLTGKTVAELRELAKAKDVKGYSTMKKAELLEALK